MWGIYYPNYSAYTPEIMKATHPKERSHGRVGGLVAVRTEGGRRERERGREVERRRVLWFLPHLHELSSNFCKATEQGHSVAQASRQSPSLSFL